MGKVLRVNLSSNKFIEERLRPELVIDYVGGRGFTSRILWDETGVETDPLSPENVLLIAPGPFAATGMPSGARMHVGAKSPITRLVGDANVGGHLGSEMKYSGYDMLIFNGRSEKPVYLLIDNGKPKLMDATHLWGENVSETDTLIKEEIGDESVKTAIIGPAGENLVKFACIVVDRDNFAARTGVGAVMGSKNLKAIAVRGGAYEVNIFNPDSFEDVIIEISQMIDAEPWTRAVRAEGTPGLVMPDYHLFGAPFKNFQTWICDDVQNLSGETLRKEIFTRAIGCFSCRHHCHKTSVITDTLYGNTVLAGPELSTINAVGFMCGDTNLSALCYANKLINEYGMDTISTGVCIAFLMECYQRKLITSEELDGIELIWGDSDSIIQLVRKIAFREGVGDFVAEGVRKMSQEIKGSESFALHCKGLENTPADGRVTKTFALWIMTSTRGSDHLRGSLMIERLWNGNEEKAEKLFGSRESIDPLSITGKGIFMKWHEDLTTMCDLFGTCKFPYLQFLSNLECVEKIWKATLKAYHLLTGIKMNWNQMMQTGERVYNLEEAYNALQGITKKEFTLPKRFQEPQHHAPVKNVIGRHNTTEELDIMVSDYFKARKWDENGVPTMEKLEELRLGSVVDKLRIQKVN